MIRLLCILTLLIGTTAQAQQDYPRDLTLSWTNSSEYIDLIIGGVVTPGGLIEPGDLIGVKVDCYRHNDTVPMLSAIVPATGEGLGQTEIYQGAIPKPGTYRCEAFSIVIGDIYSSASNPTFKKFVGKPKRVTEFIAN